MFLWKTALPAAWHPRLSDGSSCHLPALLKLPENGRSLTDVQSLLYTDFLPLWKKKNKNKRSTPSSAMLLYRSIQLAPQITGAKQTSCQGHSCIFRIAFILPFGEKFFLTHTTNTCQTAIMYPGHNCLLFILRQEPLL